MKSLRSKAVALTLGVFATGIPVAAWAQERPYEYGWGHPMWGAWGPWGIGMMLMMLVFWGLSSWVSSLGSAGWSPREKSLALIRRSTF